MGEVGEGKGSEVGEVGDARGSEVGEGRRWERSEVGEGGRRVGERRNPLSCLSGRGQLDGGKRRRVGLLSSVSLTPSVSTSLDPLS